MTPIDYSPDPEAKLPPGAMLDVVIQTSLGAEYVFPDMDALQLLKLVGNFAIHLSHTQLTLVNATGACLVLPMRVIQSVKAHRNVKSSEPAMAEWERGK